MSGQGFHVHGPHDHEIEHVAEHGAHDPAAGTIAVATAIIAAGVFMLLQPFWLTLYTWSFVTT